MARTEKDTALRGRILALALIALLLICSADLRAAAKENTAAKENEEADIFSEISRSLREAGGMVEEQSGSEISSAFFADGLEEQGQALLSELEPLALLEELRDALLGALPDAIRLFCLSGGVAVISALCRRFCDTAANETLSEGLDFCSGAALTAAMLSSGIGGVGVAEKMMEGMSSLMHSLIPVAGSVWAMGGNVGTASVGTVGLYTLLTVCEGLCLASVRPVCYVCAAVAVCGALSDGGMLSGFSSAIKKVYNFILSAAMTLIVFALSAQTAIASAADTAAARGAKLLSSSFIPVVGGAVGDTLRSVAGSIQYVKSVLGIGAIVLLGATVLPPLLSLLLSRLALLLGAGAAQMLGCERENRFLSELGNIYGMLIGAAFASAVAFVAAFAIFVRSAVAVG